MKQDLLRRVGLSAFFLICIVILGVLLLKGYPPAGERKQIDFGTVTARSVIVDERLFDRPMGTASQGNLLAVADSGAKRIVLLDIESQKETVITTAGKFGQLSYPIGVGFGPGDNLFVTDLYRGKVFEFNQKGHIKRVYPQEEDESTVGALNPVGISFDSSGRVYVTDVGRQRVVVFNNKGKFLFDFGHKGSDKSASDEMDPSGGGLLYPNGITVDDRNKRIYVADTNNARITVFNKQGDYLQDLVMPENLKLSAPRGLVLTEGGLLYIVDTMAHQIYRYNLRNSQADVVAVETGLNFPNDIAFQGERFYVADRGSNRMISFSIKDSEVKRIEK